MVDAQRLREFYENLSDDELERMSRLELIEEAGRLLQAEMDLRGLVPAAPVAEAPARRHFSLRNAYLPPAALIADPNAEAAISPTASAPSFPWLATGYLPCCSQCG
ncbi:MAG TPA: hypothetical protein VHG88_14725 [Burkholderiales bacterium]|nr:hypothetical protein [Burkholderiales bacterium]